MTLILALLVGALYAGGLYMMMRRSIVKLILGLAMLAHAANLLIFTVGGPVRGIAPIIGPGMTGLPQGTADPVPQALILTAIVIGFGVQAFALVLVKRSAQESGTDDLDAMRSTETE